MSDELNLRQEAIALAFARSASVRLTPGSLAQFAVLLCRRAENEQDRQIAAALSAMPIEQVRGFITETTAVGKRLREIAPFELLFSQDEMDIIASGIEDPVIQAGETYKRRRIDELVTGTVNASTTTSVTAEQIAAWIRDGNTNETLARITLATFFLEVPLGTQVAFLDQHGLDEERALRLATEIEVLGRTIPLQQRSRW